MTTRGSPPEAGHVSSARPAPAPDPGGDLGDLSQLTDRDRDDQLVSLIIGEGQATAVDTEERDGGRGRSLTEALQSLHVARQLLIENLVEQLGAAVGLDVLPDRLPSDLLHRAGLKFRAAAQRVRLVVGKSKSHRHW